MAHFCLYMIGAAFLFCDFTCNGDDAGIKTGVNEASAPPFPQRQPFSIEHIESGPEVLVNLPGIEKPLCFNLEVREETIRIIQDPKIGIIVNAQIFYDNLSNKTYIGATLVAKDNICLIATQYVVLVNNAKFNWGETRVLSIDGHRVVINEDIVIVAFKQCLISLVIQRHHAARENSMDYNEVGRETSNRPTGSNATDTDDKDETDSDNLPVALPLFGYAESESFINQFLSSKRRRGILLQKFFGINQDGAVVRNAIIELESEGLKKRADVVEDISGTPMDSVVLDQDKAEERPPQKDSNQQDSIKDQPQGNQQKPQQQNIHRRRRHDSKSQHDYKWEARMKREAERKRDSAIFLDIYIADARDFSNRTHGLLGQFLFKNVTREKIRYKEGKMTARLLVQDNPSRRTNALYTSRPNVARNASRACWKVRHQGRDVLDGKYSDYVVPSIWYRDMKELPPPAPL